MPLDWSQCAAVESVPGKVSGAWVFRGTRIPVTAVFENLEDGLTIKEIVQMFDGLTREQDSKKPRSGPHWLNSENACIAESRLMWRSIAHVWFERNAARCASYIRVDPRKSAARCS